MSEPTRAMNVLMLNHNPKESGTYFRCFHFARHLVRKGHKVTLMTCINNRFKPEVEYIEGVRVIGTPRFRRVADFIVPGGLDTGFLDILIRAGHTTFSNYDIIHGFDHLPNVSFPAYLGRKLRNVCFISDWCDWWTKGGFPYERFQSKRRNDFEIFLEEGIRKIADGVTVISSVLKERTEGLGVPADKIKVIPSGADINNIRPLCKKTAREKLDLPLNASILGFVGFVDVDVDLVIRAIKIVSEKNPLARALIIGVKDKAAQTAKELGIEDKVILAGIKPYSHLPDYYAAADVLAMPLRDTLFNRARWPNKIGDYLAAGRPTVSHPVGDIKRLFAEHHIGFLAEPDSAEDFAAQVARLFDDPSMASQMGETARRLAEDEYSWERMTDSLEQFYNKCLH